MSDILIVFLFTIFAEIYLMWWVSPRSTAPFYVLAQVVVFLTSLLLLSKGGNVIWGLGILLIAIGSFMFKILKHKNIEFLNKKEIYSLSMFYNEIFYRNLHKVEEQPIKIGRIIPYKESQIKKNNRVIEMPSEFLKGGNFLTGASGSGKTVFLESIMEQQIESKMPILFFDLKGEEEVIEDLRQMANKHNLPFYEMSSYRIDFNYDPLVNLPIPARVEALLNTRKWSLEGNDAHYRTATQLVIQNLVNEFEEYFDYNSNRNYLYDFSEFVKSRKVSLEYKDAHSTLVKMLDLMLTSNIASAFRGEHEREFSFDFNNQYVLVISFLSGSKELANSLASFVFRDLLNRGSKSKYPNKIGVNIDEFGSLENSFVIKDMFEKGRSANIIGLASMQDLNQVIINTNKSYLNSLLGTVNNIFIFPGAPKDMAETLSEMQTDDLVEDVIMGLNKPNPKTGSGPTALMISKYNNINRHSNTDVFKFKPFSKGLKRAKNESCSDSNISEVSGKESDKQVSIVNEEVKNKYIHEFEDDKEFKAEQTKWSQDELTSVDYDDLF